MRGKGPRKLALEGRAVPDVHRGEIVGRPVCFLDDPEGHDARILLDEEPNEREEGNEETDDDGAAEFLPKDL